MKPLKIGITGVRGIVGNTLTPELAVGFAQAFGTYMDAERIVVCRDTRPSGPMISAAVISGLLSTGCEVIDLGVCPTPSLQLCVSSMEAHGGISITAGHNPAGWNALKFARGDGLYLNPLQAEELLDIYHQGEFAKVGWDRIRTGVEMRDAIPHHLERLREAFDVEAIRARRMRVAVDCCNGACSLLIPRWLEELGCDVMAINDDPDSPFPHSPEPKPQTTSQLRAIVKAGRADIGFAHDADGERLAIVTDAGESLSEEMTLVLAASIKLEQQSGTIVTNISTSGAVDKLAARRNGNVIRTAVGQAYISEAILEHQAMIGGEGSGGVALPEVHPTHDSAAAIGLILERMARGGERVSETIGQLPRLTMIKHNIPVEPNRIYSILHELRTEIENAAGAAYDVTDGIKVSWPDGWVHFRASNTESMIRIIVEAEEEARARELLDWARDRLSG